MTTAPATEITAAEFIPDFTNIAALNLLATIAFAFAGMELVSTMGDEVDDPRRNLPRSVYIAAPLIALAYILGTAAVLWLAPPQKFDRVTGFMQAISAGVNHLDGWLWWVAPLCAALYTVGAIGGVGAWLVGPARVAFVIGLDRYFPPAFGRIHPRWHTPYIAIIAQGALATVFLLLSVLGEGTEVKEVYLILLDTQLLIYFIPYIYLFIVFLLHRRRGESQAEVTLALGGAVGGWAIGLSGLCVTLIAMIFAMIPPPETASPWLFRAKVIGGAFGFILIGGAIYWAAKTRKRIDGGQLKSGGSE
jgi:amino acid transporter